MQELISKEAVKEIFKTAIEGPGTRPYFHNAIEALPTTELHEYEVGDMVEYSSDGKSWNEGKLGGFEIEGHFVSYDFIRPLPAEHPDITQARDLASRHGFTLIKE